MVRGMPCYDSRDDPSYLQENIDYLTDLLCKAGRAFATKTEPPPDVLNWWEEHRKEDEARGEKWP
jgi:hypothetical protein